MPDLMVRFYIYASAFLQRVYSRFIKEWEEMWADALGFNVSQNWEHKYWLPVLVLLVAFGYSLRLWELI